MTYYKMSHVDHRISSVEQRISSDVPRFSIEMSELVQENLSAIFDGLLYTWRLCSYASPKYALGVLVMFEVPDFAHVFWFLHLLITGYQHLAPCCSKFILKEMIFDFICCFIQGTLLTIILHLYDSGHSERSCRLCCAENTWLCICVLFI